MRIWVGIDVGVYKSHICVTDDEGLRIIGVEEETDPDAIDLILRPFAGHISSVALEAGCGTHLARALIAHGYPVITFEARQAAKILKLNRNKTDRNDAFGMAQIARLAENVVSKVHIKRADLQRVRGWLTLRDQLVRQRKSAESALKAALLTYGVRTKMIRTQVALTSAFDEALLMIPPADRESLEDDLRPLVQIALNLRDCTDQLDKRLKDFASNSPTCSRFLQIPGVGPICATSFYTAIETPDRFSDVASVGAYLGLTPRIASSGKQQRRHRISKMGNVRTRTNLTLAARSLLRSTRQDSYIRNWGQSVRERSGYRKAEVAVARKLAVVMLAIWKNNTDYQPHPAQQ